jgi:hypothetical protein
MQLAKSKLAKSGFRLMIADRSGSLEVQEAREKKRMSSVGGAKHGRLPANTRCPSVHGRLRDDSACTPCRRNQHTYHAAHTFQACPHPRTVVCARIAHARDHGSLSVSASRSRDRDDTARAHGWVHGFMRMDRSCMGVHPVWQAVPLPCRRSRPLAVGRVARRRLIESIDRAGNSA